MITDTEFIENLNTELGERTFDRNSVYCLFEPYVKNKEALKKAADCGIFHYEYVHFSKFMKGTLFENGISLIIDMCNAAFECDKEKATIVMQKSYKEISHGFASYTQNAMIAAPIDPIARFDLITKQIFQSVGDIIENSLKPYVSFLNSIRVILKGTTDSQNKLGVKIDALIAYSDIFKALYKDLLLDVCVHQWRNIANPGDYKIAGKTVEVTYGDIKNLQTKLVTKEELIELLKTINILLYMHKIAFVLLSVDYSSCLDIAEVKKLKNPYTNKDDIVSQIVETSFSYGYRVLTIDSDDSAWKIAVETKDRENDKNALTMYLRVIAAFVENDYEMLVYAKGKVEFQVQYTNKTLSIFKYRI